MILIPAATSGEPLHVAGGTAVGVAVLGLIAGAAHANRASTAKTKRGLPAWSTGIGLAVASATVAGSEVGLVDGPVALGVIGGIVLAYSVLVGFAPRRLFSVR